MTDAEEQERHRRGAAMAERIREALEDAFEQEVRDVLRGGGDAPVHRLHDYLTGVGDHHEPRVRLLFELVEDGTLDLSGELADVPATCFFLGDAVRYQRSLEDWARLLGPARPYAEGGAFGGDVLELWSAGDLMWRADRARAQASRDFLSLLLEEPVRLLRARVRPEDLRVLAVDIWSGRDAHRVVVAPGELDAELIEDGVVVPTDRPLAPLPRLAARS